jgi:hypothetical protein
MSLHHSSSAADLGTWRTMAQAQHAGQTTYSCKEIAQHAEVFRGGVEVWTPGPQVFTGSSRSQAPLYPAYKLFQVNV